MKCFLVIIVLLSLLGCETSSNSIRPIPPNENVGSEKEKEKIEEKKKEPEPPPLQPWERDFRKRFAYFIYHEHLLVVFIFPTKENDVKRFFTTQL